MTWKMCKNIKFGGEKMKSVGMVRRVDDLGRVVIPKEIRRKLRITEGAVILINHTAMLKSSDLVMAQTASAFLGSILEND